MTRNSMTQPSMAPVAPNLAETISFLRRFGNHLKANGYNVAYLHRAADLLETLATRVIAASDEEDLWRHRHENLARRADALETEREVLKQDIEGHLDITASVLRERDALGAALKAREAELSELRGALSSERDERAAGLAAQEVALAGLRLAFDHEREALMSGLEGRGRECDQLRRELDREREQFEAAIKAREEGLAELRLALERERAEFQAQLKARGDELAAFHADSEREHDALSAKIATLEAKRAELRAAFERISNLRDRTIEYQGSADRSAAGTSRLEEASTPLLAQRGERDAAVGEADAVVPKNTLRQARAQFEYLAKECITRGDIASQVMCELGAYTMDMALIAGQQLDHPPVGEIAESILARAADR